MCSVQYVGPLKALYSSPPGRPVHSDTNSTSLGSIQPYCNYKYYSLTFPLLSIARYSFIQLNELGHCGEIENAQASKRWQKGFEPGISRLRVRHSTAELSRSTITPQFCRHTSSKCSIITKFPVVFLDFPCILFPAIFHSISMIALYYFRLHMCDRF